MKILAIIIAFYYLYHLIFLMIGLTLNRKKEVKQGKGENIFAVFVPAHNEENVIRESLASIMGANYPKENFKVYVIADNCTDRTVEFTNLAGAIALERRNDKKRGKQHALAWAYEQVDLSKFDAVLIMDADNHIDPDLFTILDYELENGHKVIQAYVETKNPSESWISINYGYTYWYMFRSVMARCRLGLSGWLAGTGVCIDTEIIQKVKWELNTLTDDVEYTCKLLLHGEKVYLASNALVYDQKPNDMKFSWRQRLRWVRGQTQVGLNYLPRLAVMTFKSWLSGDIKKTLITFDALMWVPMQLILLSSFALSIFLSGWTYFLSLIITVPLLYTLPLLAEEVKIKKAWTHLITASFFWITWIPITAYGVITHGNKEWFRTPH
ncbi:glycosyltransferase family 2 protein [Desulfitobacterium hafniense]|uniref:glycosyltransferase family 2 protein n=1 Tax=Desulfitobacterium hafniense TaxID=49338 RepID=UPI00035C6B2B|nr:glycosyltransferase family 2 protein [Desulfitobacterium hafniense]